LGGKECAGEKIAKTAPQMGGQASGKELQRQKGGNSFNAGKGRLAKTRVVQGERKVYRNLSFPKRERVADHGRGNKHEAGEKKNFLPEGQRTP